MSTTLPGPATPAVEVRPVPQVAPTTLVDVLGGRRSALDATLPSAAFVVGLVVTGRTAPDAVLAVSLAAGTLTALGVAGWRADPCPYRGYARASWWWAGSFALRTVVLGALYLASSPVLLGVVQVGLSWPLMTSVLVVSWRVLRRALPPGHPGLLHPVPVV